MLSLYEINIVRCETEQKDLVKFMKIAREQGHEAMLMYNKLRINGRMYTLEQLGEKQASNEVCERPNKTSNPKRTASDRSPQKKRKRRKEGKGL